MIPWVEYGYWPPYGRDWGEHTSTLAGSPRGFSPRRSDAGYEVLVGRGKTAQTSSSGLTLPFECKLFIDQQQAIAF